MAKSPYDCSIPRQGGCPSHPKMRNGLCVRCYPLSRREKGGGNEGDALEEQINLNLHLAEKLDEEKHAHSLTVQDYHRTRKERDEARHEVEDRWEYAERIRREHEARCTGDRLLIDHLQDKLDHANERTEIIKNAHESRCKRDSETIEYWNTRAQKAYADNADLIKERDGLIKQVNNLLEQIDKLS